jgi:hypothetical protein
MISLLNIYMPFKDSVSMNGGLADDSRSGPLAT